MFPKPKTYRNKKLLKFVRTLPCCVSFRTGEEIVYHHLEGVGTGMKGDDRLVVPLSGKPHNEVHNTGRKAFEEKYGVDLKEENLKTLMKYVEYLEP